MEKDKKFDANIRISGIHLTENDGDDVREEHTGILSKKADKIYIVYEDAGIRNLIKVGCDTVSLTKSCLYHGKRRTMAELAYISGKSVPGFYETPYGRLEPEMETEVFAVKEGEKTVSCMLKGRMKINGSFVSDFNLHIEAAVI